MKFIDIRKIVVSAFLISATLFVSQAQAHKLNLFAYAEGYEVYLEGYFADGKRAQNSKVEVFNPAGELLVEGITGNEGEYRFTVSKPEDLRIVLNAGMGHQGEYLLPASEIGDGTVAPGLSQEHAVSSSEQLSPASGQDVTDNAATVPGNYSATQLEKVVHKAVNEAIKPLVRELDESRQKASLTGIVGAIGYIFGFLGLFALFKARQMQQAEKK